MFHHSHLDRLQNFAVVKMFENRVKKTMKTDTVEEFSGVNGVMTRCMLADEGCCSEGCVC